MSSSTKPLARSCALALGLAILFGCQRPQLPAERPPTERASVDPRMTRGATVYEIDARQSEIRALVFRTGRLAKLGHNHIISSGELSGRVYLQSEFSRSGFELRMPVASLIVDDPTLRAQEGEDFPGEIPEKDIAGTRENMLSPKVLDAQGFPEVTITAIGAGGAPPSAEMTFQIVLRGTPANYTAPVTVEIADGKVIATGQMDLSHADFGLQPFSVLGGAIAVADRVPIKFRLVALEN